MESDIQKNILQFWESHQIHQKLNDLNKCNVKLTIYDGPPFPTGPPHHGHMMTSVVKDTVIRYLMSTGHYVPRKIGWDMFGNHVDDKCGQYIESWIEIMRSIGRWIDMSLMDRKIRLSDRRKKCNRRKDTYTDG